MKTINWLTAGSLCIASSVLITACSSYSAPSHSTSTASAPAPIETIQVIQTESPALITPASTAQIEKSGEHATIAGNAASQTSDPVNAGSALPAYNNKQPRLMALAIHETQDQVTIKYGAPKDSFIMDDPSEPISVYQYEGFSVGFSPDKQIKFVDVSSASINPGLNGLRLGQTADDAIHAIGKPDGNSVYVMTYKTKNEILKLDIDPKTKTIQSIKLFGAN